MEQGSTIDLRSIHKLDRPARVIVLMASSMGGTKVLYDLLPLFDDAEGLGIVIVQHMPKEFTGSFSERLNNVTGFDLKEAQDGDRICAGKALLAPGGLHLIIEKGKMGWYRVKTMEGPPVKGVKPAADVLFASAAASVNIPIVAVVLTGMGSDGADGVAQLKKNEALVITQTEETCSVYGMPRAVVERGLSDASLPVEEIPEYIKRKKGSLKRRITHPVDEFRIGL